MINCKLYSIGKIKKYLDQSIKEKLLIGAVTANLDYDNSLRYSMRSADIKTFVVLPP